MSTSTADPNMSVHTDLQGDQADAPVTPLQNAARLLLGGAMIFAGISHLTFARKGFRAQVPESLPVDDDFTVLASGVVEISLGVSLIALAKQRVTVGWILAGFFTAIFPGNLSPYLTHGGLADPAPPVARPE